MKVKLDYELKGAKEVRTHRQFFEKDELVTDPIGKLSSMIELHVKRWIVIRDQFYISALIKELLTEDPITLGTMLRTPELKWIRQIPSHRPGIYVELTLELL